MAYIALKVDVDTLRGTLEGVPRLMHLLDRHRMRATFLFSLGPDHTGWALRRALRPGFLAKASRTSVLRHYGLRTLCYGVLLPAPDIGAKASEPMRDCLAAGHECGIHAWDHVLWQDNVRHRDAAWTRAQMVRAHARYLDIMRQPPSTAGAAGWQTNETALRIIDEWQLAYASDSRGSGPYRPQIDGIALRHVQRPTTLPTLDELLGAQGIDASNVHDHVLAQTRASRDHVFTLHAELEGGQLQSSFERLIEGWRTQGHRLGPLADCPPDAIDRLPRLPLRWRSIAGRSGEVVDAFT